MQNIGRCTELRYDKVKEPEAAWTDRPAYLEDMCEEIADPHFKEDLLAYTNGPEYEYELDLVGELGNTLRYEL